MATLFHSHIPTPRSRILRRRRRILCELEEQQQQQSPKKQDPGTKIQLDSSTDWIASSLTRRFGLGAGLGYVGFLAFGVISEQIKTRTEVALEEQGSREIQDGKETVLPNGVRFTDLVIGGGASPKRGDLVVVDLVGRVTSTGEKFVDTIGNKRPLVFVYGAKPYSGGMCDGLEFALASMNAGGERRVIVPPALGFGERGEDFGAQGRVDPDQELEFVVQLRKVSISPT
ncbi:peptidyl-prolyl cis-trans isomerase FKBP17-2, chloroplastic [Selaginella moellendorffii]|nr:peptidyl-prolyl cis-trans isomerase FKBP17-2, chloroplastic [Selaginella moellendorffii]|eukprot:XP_002987400.2 peptidyl-prolyl cis-trans isomerase FKBP17-2, chloroplastic [Selaginella moellendorffii]